MNKKIIRYAFCIITLLLILLGVCFVSLKTGTIGYSAREVIASLFGRHDSIAFSIIWNLRFQRIVLGLAVGGGLSLVGVMLQAMFRNPLVEPYTLGISGGACLGVSLSLGLRGSFAILGNASLAISGFLGSLLVVCFLYSISLRKGLLELKGVLLSGVMVSYISSSLIMLVMALSKTEDLHGIVMWTMGYLGKADWKLTQLAALCSFLGLITACFLSVRLNALSLGEEQAAYLGLNVERLKKIIFLMASLLTGVFVSVCGIVGFVGLVVPHFMRIVCGRDHRILLLSSYLAGAIFLISCDIAARTIILPLELPVGVITGIIGGSVFIYALGKKRYL
ncbi:MAG: iron ABC transporter permease [Candidatus Omnitrophota bacterium]